MVWSDCLTIFLISALDSGFNHLKRFMHVLNGIFWGYSCSNCTTFYPFLLNDFFLKKFDLILKLCVCTDFLIVLFFDCLNFRKDFSTSHVLFLMRFEFFLYLLIEYGRFLLHLFVFSFILCNFGVLLLELLVHVILESFYLIFELFIISQTLLVNLLVKLCLLDWVELLNWFLHFK